MSIFYTFLQIELQCGAIEATDDLRNKLPSQFLDYKKVISFQVRYALNVLVVLCLVTL